MNVIVTPVARKEARLQRKVSNADKATTVFAVMTLKDASRESYHPFSPNKIRKAAFRHASTCRALQHELALNVRGAVMRNEALMDIISQNRAVVIKIDILMSARKKGECVAVSKAPENVDTKQPQIWGDFETYGNGNAYSTYTFYRKEAQSQGKQVNLGRIAINLKEQMVKIDYPKTAVGFGMSGMETVKIWRIFEIGEACRDYCKAIKRYVPQ